MLRSVMLKMAQNRPLLKTVNGLGTRYGFARRFVAGETMAEAIEVVRDFNRRNILASLDVLGEGVRDEAEANKAADSYISLLDYIANSGVQSNVSIKLTQLGLDVGQEVCRANLGRIIEKARSVQNSVTIDMESSQHTERTLELFEERMPQDVCHLGIVIQAYLYRSEDDLRRLSAHGCSIRLCKGAYMEPAGLAFPKKKDVDQNFIKLMEFMLMSPLYTAIASHDSRIISRAQKFIREKQVPGDKYEFQMLYGVRRESQLELARKGFKMRVYVPYGRHWAPYYMRRLAERPANVLFILRNLMRR